MGLSVIIPSRNDGNLAACIGRIHRRNGYDTRTIVIDDGLEYMPTTPTLPGIKPFCFARNVNIGINAAGDDDVIVLNDDALLESESGFCRLLGVYRNESCRQFGIVSAAVRGASNSAEHSPQDGWGQVVIREAKRKDVPFVCVLIPRSTINRVGLLDERFFGEIDGQMIYGGEDTDYCLRVRRAGMKIGIYDGCVVDHCTLPSTFRPDGKGLSIAATDKRFREIHGHGLWDA